MGSGFPAPARDGRLSSTHTHLACQPGGFGPRRNLDTEPNQLLTSQSISEQDWLCKGFFHGPAFRHA